MAKVKVRIKKDGSIEIEVEGVKGGRCLDLTKALEGVGKVVERKKKKEFYEKEEKVRYVEEV